MYVLYCNIYSLVLYVCMYVCMYVCTTYNYVLVYSVYCMYVFCVMQLVRPWHACAHSEGYCSCPVCVCTCTCVSVCSFLPPRASRPRNIGTYVFTVTLKKNFYNCDFR